MEWFKANTQTIARDVGLAGNDVASFYPLMGFVMCMTYFFTNRQKVIGDYFQGQEEYEKIHDVKVVAQLGLKFFTTTSNIMGVYNESTPSEKNAREDQFIQFIRVAKQQTGMGKAGMFMETEIVSAAAKSASDELPAQNKDVHNTDCERNFPQTSWWKAKYTFSSICENETPVVTRYLPISFYLEGTEANGARVILYGALRALKVEADRDVAGAVPVDSVAWKMYMELVDCNWRQKGGEPGVNHVFKFICSQQNDKCIFSSLVGSDGKPFNVFVSQFKLRMRKQPIDVTSSEILPGFLKDDEDSLAELSIHPGRDLLLSYMVRSLPLIDSTVTHSKDKKKQMLLMGGASSTTQLPLEVHIRSPEPLNDRGDKFVAYPVMRVMLRYVSDPPTPGEMDPDGAAVRSIQLLLPNSRILAQDVTDKKKWVVNDTTLHRDATIDLIMLNKTPFTGGKNRKPGMGGGAKASIENGRIYFTSFPGVRQGWSEITVSETWQDKIRSEPDSASQAWTDLRVRAKDDRPTFAEILGDRRENAIVLGGVAALMLGWKLGTRETVTSIGFLASGFGYAVALVVFACAIMEYIERLPPNLRPYEPVMYVMTCVSVLMSVATILYASRFVPETSPGLYISAAIALLSAVMVLSFETESPAPMAPSTLSVKIGLMFVMAVSLFLLASEISKVYRKTEVGFAALPLPTSVGNLPNLAAAVSMLAVLVVVAGLSLLFMRQPPDSCERLIFERTRIASDVHQNHRRRNKKEAEAHRYFVGELNDKDREINACFETHTFPFPKLNALTNPGVRDLVPFIIVAIPLYMNMVSPAIGRFIGNRWPSRLSQESDPRPDMPNAPNAARRVEDGRIPRGVWVIKTLLGIILVISVARLLLPHASVDPGQCTFLRDMEMRNREITRANPLVYDAKKRMTLVHQGEWRFDCIPKDQLATVLVMGGLGLVLMLSFLAPARKRFVPTSTSGVSVLVNLVFFVMLSGVMVWSYVEPNRVKILNL